MNYTPKVKQQSVKPFSRTGGRLGAAARLPTSANAVYVRQTDQIKSLSTPGGSTATKEIKKYTGTEIIGLAVMHKSSIVPIFSKTEATEVASMRR